MANTRKRNVVIYVMKNDKKLYFKGYSQNGQRNWTYDINKAFKQTLREAQKYITSCLYNHEAHCEVIEQKVNA